MTRKNKVKQNCKQLITLWLLISAAAKAAAKLLKKTTGTKTSARQFIKRIKRDECTSKKLPDADGAKTSWVVPGPETKRASRPRRAPRTPADGANLPGVAPGVTRPRHPLTPVRVIHEEMSIVLDDVVKSPGELFYSSVWLIWIKDDVFSIEDDLSAAFSVAHGSRKSKFLRL